MKASRATSSYYVTEICNVSIDEFIHVRMFENQKFESSFTLLKAILWIDWNKVIAKWSLAEWDIALKITAFLLWRVLCFLSIYTEGAMKPLST